MIYLTLGVIVLTLFILYILRDINKVLRINSIITISSGYLVILSSIIINMIIKDKIAFINTSIITNEISNKGINRGLILILFGAIQLIIHTGINIYKNSYIIK